MIRPKKFVIGALLALFASPLAAQDAIDCDWPARADAIVEPWEDNTRTFANGNVRLALLDTIEPAAAAFHILVMSPPYDELGGRQCKTIGLGGMGFAGVNFETLNARYDAAVGLVFSVDVNRLTDMGEIKPATLWFTLNQATGDIGTWLE